MAPRHVQWYHTDLSDSSMNSKSSNSSNLTRSTAPTQYDLPSRPSLRKHETAAAKLSGFDDNVSPSCSAYDPRDSASTYASTIPSEEDLAEDDPEYQVLEHKEQDYRHQIPSTNAIPSTPPEFAELFPSTRRLLVRHDDTTIDGNMNLRVDTPISASYSRQRDVTLFHLRMHDLKSREFSLRRYCRESGREVCHSKRVTKHAATPRPGLQRSVSNVFSSLRGHHKTESKGASSSSGLRRHDSGYDSFDDDAHSDAASVSSSKAESSQPTNITKLEFSNYAQVDVARHGSSSSKRYEFEYWGTNYSWRRYVKKDDEHRQASFHLINGSNGSAVAHIVPESLSDREAAAEQAKGGWIPPCAMWISDQTILSGLTDVADVIVSTGLIALVDDSISHRFHTKRSVYITVPVPMKTPLKLNVETMSPKSLITEVFSRRNSAHSRHPTPLRQISAEA